MIDPRVEAVLIRRRDQPGYEDKTSSVKSYAADGDYVHVIYSGGTSSRGYRYSARNVLILGNPVSRHLDAGQSVVANGQVVFGATEVLSFEEVAGTWCRIFYGARTGEKYITLHREDVEIVIDAARATGGQEILAYWRDVASNFEPRDSLRSSYDKLRNVPSGSVLDLYLRGIANEEPAPQNGELIFPFSSNVSQRIAVERGLSHRISVIDGPPGTGKTETILNLIANIVRNPGQTVGLASFTNAAVENVRDKLTQAGYGHVLADLGSNEKKTAFFTTKHAANAQAHRQAGSTPVDPPEIGRVQDLSDRAYHLQMAARSLAQLRQELDAFRLEQRHFARHIDYHRPAPLPSLKLLEQPSKRILEFLADTATVRTRESSWHRLFRRFRTRIRYGSMRGVDPGDSDVVLQLQAAFYIRKIEELETEIQLAEDILEKNPFTDVERELKEASRQALAAGLHQRYLRLRQSNFSADNYRRQFHTFVSGYPVILSTCHSLQRSLPDGYLLDYLIIDEASQVDLLAAGLALACARNVIVVGDLRQLPHIPETGAARKAMAAPTPDCDYERHSILSSLIERYGSGIPRTMLREHYRCAPEIIDFCNRKFYAGQLIPYTSSSPGGDTLVVVRTVPGNHMRQHNYGGRTNQREADVIAEEVLQRFCAGTRYENIGVITPYRRQVDKVADALLNVIEADTVHKFQGREKEIMIMSTVLDESRQGNFGIGFVDNPQLVNVAVSRAVRRFILVTNHDMLPSSRHIRDLVHFIQYRNPDDGVVDSKVVSVFDLLYREYSAALEPLASRLGKTSAFASENIIWTLLQEMLAKEDYFSDLAVAQQILLRNMLSDISTLTTEQANLVRNRASLDFVVYNRVTNRPVLALEVDGFAFHEADREQQVRDRLKDAICRSQGLRLLRLPTTGSGEELLIHTELLAAIT